MWEEKCAGGTGFAQLKPGITLAMWTTRLAVNYLNDYFSEKEMTIPMSAVYIISKNGERLMPTVRYGHVRHLLKDGKAIVFSRHPFTIQLTYDTSEFVQPIEITESIIKESWYCLQ